MSSFGPLVLIEVVLVLGGAIAFAWWQLRDVDRAQRETRERRAREAAAVAAEPEPVAGAAPATTSTDPPADAPPRR